MSIFIGLFIFIIVFGLLLVFKFTKKYKLSSQQKSFILRNQKKIISSSDYKHQIIDFDKLYHKVLLEAGYNGSFGSILKSEPTEIGDINKIWELHKLRNKLVHDFDTLSDSVLKQKALDYNKEIAIIIKQFT